MSSGLPLNLADLLRQRTVEGDRIEYKAAHVGGPAGCEAPAGSRSDKKLRHAVSTVHQNFGHEWRATPGATGVGPETIARVW